MSISPARKTEYLGEVFRSKSEAIFARMLTERGFDQFDYEPDWTQLDCGYVPDFNVHSIFDSPIGPIEIGLIIEYKPAPVTETYKDELLERFNKIKKKNQFVNRGTIFSLWVGNAFDSEPCHIYTMSDCGKIFYPEARAISQLFKGDLVAAKDYRFDLAVV